MEIYFHPRMCRPGGDVGNQRDMWGHDVERNSWGFRLRQWRRVGQIGEVRGVKSGFVEVKKPITEL